METTVEQVEDRPAENECFCQLITIKGIERWAGTTGAALDGKNTSPEKLTTQDGHRFPRSNN